MRSHFGLASLLSLSTACCLPLFLGSGAPAEGLAGAYLVTTAGYYGLALCAVGLLLSPLARWKATRWIWPTLGGAWLAYLLVDAAVHDLYRFHLDGLMLEMLLFDFKGVGLPPFVLVVALLGAVALGAGVWATTRLVAPRVPTRANWALAALWLFLFVGNSATHIWAARYDRSEILRHGPSLPAYAPFSSHGLAEGLARWLPSVFPPVHGEAAEDWSVGASAGRYPLAQPEFERAQPARSILLVAIESLQADALDPEVMPNLWALSARGTRHERHLSSGSSTVPGLFGLLHGVHPTSYEVFRSAPRDHQSVLVRSAARAGLEVHVHTSGSLERFALRSLFFGDVPAERYHQFRDDARLVEAWTQSLPADPRVGRFDFLFLTSTHSPYHCPKEEIRFQPLPAIEGRYALDADADPIPYRNDYKNSARHVDRLLGLVVAELERRGRLDDTWIVVTGDHGEEFNEGGQGYWGHGSNFGRWQVQVPLVLVGPGAPVGVVERRVSLHQDIAPTLMEMALGCTTPPEAYSHGTSLLRLPERRATVLSSYVESAYWIDGVVVEKRIGRRYRFDDLSPAAEPDREALRRVFEEERRFLGR